MRVFLTLFIWSSLTLAADTLDCAFWTKYLDEIALWESIYLDAIKAKDFEYAYEIKERIKRIQESVTLERYGD